MISFILIILIVLYDALARDPNRFAHLLTERLNAFVEAEAAKKGIADDHILALIQQGHNVFKKKMPSVLKEFDHIPLPNQSMIAKVSKATMIKLQHTLIKTYHDSSNALEKRTDSNELFNRLRYSGPGYLDKISQYNLEPSLFAAQRLRQSLLKERQEVLALLGKYDEFQKLDIPKEFESIYFTDLPGGWDFLKNVEKNLVLDLLLIEHKLRNGHKLKPWLEEIISWIKKSKNLTEDEKKESILIFEGRYDALHVDALLSTDEILAKILSSERGAPDDYIMELIEYVANNTEKGDQDRAKKGAATIYKRIHKKLKLSPMMGFLTKTSTIFFLAFGFSMLIFYYSDKKD